MGDVKRNDTRDEFMAYLKGWADGASIKAIRPEFQGHALESAYGDGYSDGRAARHKAHEDAAKKYGQQIRILRAPKSIGPDVGDGCPNG